MVVALLCRKVQYAILSKMTQLSPSRRDMQETKGSDRIQSVPQCDESTTLWKEH